MYTDVCRCIPMYTDVCRCMPMYADVCQFMPMYANVYRCMPMYADVCRCIWARKASSKITNSVVFLSVDLNDDFYSPRFSNSFLLPFCLFASSFRSEKHFVSEICVFV